MATSTEETVRDAIVAAIRGVAQSDLGFDLPYGNVKDYLYEFEADERKGAYLMTMVGGKKTIRCWAVDVLGDDDWYASNNVTKRDYQITIRGYYDLGVDGAGVKALVTGARKVREAIRSLNSTLGNRVDLIRDTSALAREIVTGIDPQGGKVLVGTMVYLAERRGPDF